MKILSCLAGAAAAGTLLVAGALAPAQAASAQTDAFVANVRPNVLFLDETSRMALDKSGSPAVRAFARAEARQQTIASNSLTAWAQTNTIRGEAVALGAPVITPLAPIADLAVAPVDVAAGVATGVDNVVSGRSVALDAPLTVTRPVAAPVIGSQLLPAEQDDMARLTALNGRAFDALYKSTQLDGLLQLATLYRDYAINGDDPALRTMAASELPRVNARIATLRRL